MTHDDKPTPFPPRRKPIFTEERATFLFGAKVETGETPDAFADRLIEPLKRAGIRTEEGRRNPRLTDGKRGPGRRKPR